jgi:hypothetical protein
MLISECVECRLRFRSRFDFQDHADKTGHKAVEVYDTSKQPSGTEGT